MLYDRKGVRWERNDNYILETHFDIKYVDGFLSVLLQSPTTIVNSKTKTTRGIQSAYKTIYVVSWCLLVGILKINSLCQLVIAKETFESKHIEQQQ